jgi:predicted kinase
LAFSGKSTLARALATRTGATLVTLDAINAERGIDGGDPNTTDAMWEETSGIACERMAASLRAGRDVVLDDTLSHRFLRERYRKVAHDCGAAFRLIVVETPLEEISRRRAANGHSRGRPDIADAVFEAHLARFEWPGADEVPLKVDGRAADPSSIFSRLLSETTP